MIGGVPAGSAPPENVSCCAVQDTEPPQTLMVFGATANRIPAVKLSLKPIRLRATALGFAIVNVSVEVPPELMEPGEKL